MRITRNLRLSVHALSTHRTRALLAAAGTALGVAGVVMVTAIGEGARHAVMRRIQSLGRNMLVVSAARTESRAGREIQRDGWVRTLRTSDAAAVLRGSPGIIRAAPAQDRGMVARYGPIQTSATVLGTTPEWRLIRQFPLAEGRFFTRQENHQRARVAVLGSAIRENLFDTLPAVGRTIRIGVVPFEVIGVLASKGVSPDGSASEDDRIVVPLETGLRRLFNLDYVKLIYLEVDSAASDVVVAEEAAAILRVRHGLPPGSEDDFAIQNQRVLLAAEEAARQSFQRLILGCALLSLMVGGAGILSVMMLAIRERRPEIGLRMAVGARRRDIAQQFLSEALMLAIAGGAAGLGLGLAGSGVVSALTSWNAQAGVRLLAVSILAVIGLAAGSGLWPAWRAARLEPVEALRREA